MSSLKLTNVKKSYADVEVLHGVSLDVAPGEFIAVVGPSGCGKSSLLRMVAGLESVTHGEIAIADVRVNEVEPKARDIAMVFQNYALYPHMTVYKNMAYGLKMRGYSKHEIDQRVNEAAELLQLSDYLDRKPAALSGGQRQRVAMGRAIVRKPVVFLFDEPLSNLDTKLRMEMRLEIKKLQQRLGITCLYVTHDQTEAMTMADRIVVLNKGYVEQVATPYEIYHHPQTQFVAGFMGLTPMNFFPVIVQAGNVFLQGYEQPIAQGVKCQSDAEMWLGVRPEDFVLAAMDGLPFIVEMGETLGADLLIHGKVLGLYDSTIRREGYKPVTMGDQLCIAIDKAKLHLFDKTTGHRLEGIC